MSLYFAVNFNHIQRVNWLHASNSVSAGINNTSTNINGYFRLKSENGALAASNGVLLAEIERLNKINEFLSDSLYGALAKYPKDTTGKDSLQKAKISINLAYNSYYIPAKVVQNSVIGNENFITIDKGELDGVKIGNGIVTSKGILGKVVSTARHHSLVKSVLHVRNTVSAKIESTNELGSIKWSGESSRWVLLTEVPRHVPVKKGDTVITSSYNSVYPANHPIGKIVNISVDEDQPFWRIEVELFEKIRRANHCFVYQNDEFIERNMLSLRKDSIY